MYWNDIWAIRPETLQWMAQTWRAYLRGDDGHVALARQEVLTTQAGQVAVLPIVGPIYPRGGGGLFEMLFGGMALDRLSAAFSQRLNDPGVAAIVLDFDSPGGSVAGVPEFADLVAGARGRKPIVALSNTLMASAAYWIGAQADEVMVSPSSQTGSIGIYATHFDMSRALDAEGVTPTLISAGKYKTDGNQYQPLSEEARADWQGQVDAYYEMFVAAVARGRARSEATVRNGFGEGRVLTAQAAVDAHMADRIGTLNDAVGRALALAKRRAGAQAEALRMATL